MTYINGLPWDDLDKPDTTPNNGINMVTGEDITTEMLEELETINNKMEREIFITAIETQRKDIGRLTRLVLFLSGWILIQAIVDFIGY